MKKQNGSNKCMGHDCIQAQSKDSELEYVDRKPRKTMICLDGALNPRSNVDRLYIKA